MNNDRYWNRHSESRYISFVSILAVDYLNTNPEKNHTHTNLSSEKNVFMVVGWIL